METRNRWIAEQNVARFEKQLAIETDAGRREILERLLSQERERLSAAGQSDATAGRA